MPGEACGDRLPVGSGGAGFAEPDVPLLPEEEAAIALAAAAVPAAPELRRPKVGGAMVVVVAAIRGVEEEDGVRGLQQ